MFAFSPLTVAFAKISATASSCAEEPPIVSVPFESSIAAPSIDEVAPILREPTDSIVAIASINETASTLDIPNEEKTSAENGDIENI
jgi:hypothetical protein